MNHLLVIALMLFLLAGFTAYVIGASRERNALASGVTTILAFAYVVPASFLLGWWIYRAMPGGLTPADVATARTFGPDLSDPNGGLNWALFALFGCTAAAIFSGAVAERIRVSAFILLSLLLGAVLFHLVSAWAWHPAGWLIQGWGYRDAALAGPLHLLAAAFALGVMVNLGPRVDKFRSDGTSRDLDPHNMPLTVTGLMLVLVGFFGLIGACYLYSRTGDHAEAFGSRATLSAYLMNALMSSSGGIIGCYFMTKNPYWMMRGALGGLVLASAGLDLWYPPLAFALGFAGGLAIPVGMRFVERLGLDDVVSVVAVHGVCGFAGVLAVGVLAAGYPAAEGVPLSSFAGQLVGGLVILLTGLLAGFIMSLLLRLAGVLRIPDSIAVEGIDNIEVSASAYPESSFPKATKSTSTDEAGRESLADEKIDEEA